MGTAHPSRPALPFKMTSPVFLVAFFLCGICLATPTADRGSLKLRVSRCEPDPSEEHTCCYPAGEISIDNCDCDAGVLCDIYCGNLDYANSWYDWGAQLCCCDN